MRIGDKISAARKLRRMTQKELGLALGFDEPNAGVRIVQYEKGKRVPKKELIQKMSEILDVSPLFLDVPECEDSVGLIQKMFELEDIYGIKIEKSGNGFAFQFKEIDKGIDEAFHQWTEIKEKKENGQISQKEYDEWRYQMDKIAGADVHKEMKKIIKYTETMKKKQWIDVESPCAHCERKELYERMLRVAVEIAYWLGHCPDYEENIKKKLSCHYDTNENKQEMSVEQGIVKILKGQSLYSREVKLSDEKDIEEYKAAYKEMIENSYGFEWLKEKVESIEVDGELKKEEKLRILEEMEEMRKRWMRSVVAVPFASSKMYQLYTTAPKNEK